MTSSAIRWAAFLPAFVLCFSNWQTNNLSAESPTLFSSVWLLDLDIDSDNDNGFLLPDGSEWEEQIEEHKFSIGKLIETGAKRFTPVVIRLDDTVVESWGDGGPPSDSIRLSFNVENAQGEVRLWTHSQFEATSRQQKAAPLMLGKAYSLDELAFDPAEEVVTIWMEGVKAAPGIKTKTAIDENGRPDMFLSATLTGVPGQNAVTDRVKYLPVDPDSFFTAWVAPGNRKLRNSMAAMLVNGPGGLGGTSKPVPPEQSKAYGVRLVTEDELVRLLGSSDCVENQQRYILGVVYSKLRTFGIPGLNRERDLRIGLYRDYNSGDYTLAFQYLLEDNCTQLFQQVKPDFYEVQAFRFLAHRTAAGFIACYLSDAQYAVELPSLQVVGVGVGGDLAVCSALSSGLHADTYNMTPLTLEMTKQFLTQYHASEEKRIESVPGSLERLERAQEFISAYRINEIPYRVMPGRFPIQPVP